MQISPHLEIWLLGVAKDGLADGLMGGSDSALQDAIISAEAEIDNTTICKSDMFLSTVRQLPIARSSRFAYVSTPINKSVKVPTIAEMSEQIASIPKVVEALEDVNLSPSTVQRAHAILSRIHANIDAFTCTEDPRRTEQLFAYAVTAACATVWRFYRHIVKLPLSNVAEQAVFYGIIAADMYVQRRYIPSLVTQLCLLYTTLLGHIQEAPVPFDLSTYVAEMYDRQRKEYPARIHLRNEFERLAQRPRDALIRRRESVLQVVNEGKSADDVSPSMEEMSTLFEEFEAAVEELDLKGRWPDDMVVPPCAPPSLSTEDRELAIDPSLVFDETNGLQHPSLMGIQNVFAQVISEHRLNVVPPKNRICPPIEESRRKELLALLPKDLPIQHSKMALSVRMCNPFINPANPYICDFCNVAADAGYQAVMEEGGGGGEKDGRYAGSLIRNCQGFDVCPACALYLFDEACTLVSGTLMSPLPQLPPVPAVNDTDVPLSIVRTQKRDLFKTIDMKVVGCRWITVAGTVMLSATVGISPLGTRPFGRLCLPEELPAPTPGAAEATTLPPPVEWLAESSSTARQVGEENALLDENCSICLEQLDRCMDFEGGAEVQRPSHRSVVQTICHHWFHSHCLESYFATGRDAASACPLCRRPKCLSEEIRAPEVVMRHNLYDLLIPIPPSAMEAVSKYRQGEGESLPSLVLVLATAVSLDCAVRNAADVGLVSTIMLYR